MLAKMNKIEDLELNKKLLDKLKENNINKIIDLQNLRRSDLRNMHFDKNEIDEIIVKLELSGTDLNKNNK